MTVIQPSGTKSLMTGSTPGGHPGFDEYFIRRIRFAANDPLIPILMKAKYHIEPEIRFDGSFNHDLLVVDFPCKFESDTLLAKDCGVIKQLEIMKDLQTYWADQSVSITAYYKKDDLPDIQKWLKENYNNNVKTVSFLLHQDHNFKQAPYESITKEKYESLKSKVKPLSEINVGNELFDGIECVGGACPVR